jgi:hypothetical protein
MIAEPSRLSSRKLPQLPDRRDVSRALAGLVVLSVGRGSPEQIAVNRALKSAGAVVLLKTSASETAQMLRAFIPSAVVIDAAPSNDAASAVVRAIRRLPAEDGGALPVIGICGQTPADVSFLGESFQALLVHPFEAADVAQTILRAIEEAG